MASHLGQMSWVSRARGKELPLSLRSGSEPERIAAILRGMDVQAITELEIDAEIGACCDEVDSGNCFAVGNRCTGLRYLKTSS